ncbi:MAG: DivIVA domain-containing protein [Melioribacteraceae bacterium]
MKFTPFGIKSQEFNRTVRGFDRDEVKVFLERLADEFEKLQNENEKLKAELEKQEDQLKEFKRIEKSLQQAMLNQTESTSKTVESAKKQTALMIKEAELKSLQIVENAKEKANSLRDSLLRLREEKKLLVARIKAMIDSQSSFLEMNMQNIETQPKKKIASKQEVNSDEQAEINIDDILEKLL